jgi:hypothetical protein
MVLKWEMEFSSLIGSPSSSHLNNVVGPGSVPSKTNAKPVPPSPVMVLSGVKLLKKCWTLLAVSASCPDNSGNRWRIFLNSASFWKVASSSMIFGVFGNLAVWKPNANRFYMESKKHRPEKIIGKAFMYLQKIKNFFILEAVTT